MNAEATNSNQPKTKVILGIYQVLKLTAIYSFHLMSELPGHTHLVGKNSTEVFCSGIGYNNHRVH